MEILKIVKLTNIYRGNSSERKRLGLERGSQLLIFTSTEIFHDFYCEPRLMWGL